MDYAEKALNELIERYKNMTKEEYEEIYNSVMSKMKRKDILQNCIDVKKSENIKSYKKNIWHPSKVLYTFLEHSLFAGLFPKRL